MVRSFPAVSALRARYGQAHIAWLVEAKAAAAVALHPAPDAVLVFPREAIEAALAAGRPLQALRSGFGFVRELRAQRFDLVVDLHSILKSGLLSRLSGARRRVGFAWPEARELAWCFANERVSLAGRSRSRFDRNAALVEWLTGAALPVGAGRIEAPEAARERIREALGPRTGAVVMHPGSSAGAPYKRYPAAGFAAVARALARDPGLACVVACGAGEDERRLAQEVVAQSDGAAWLAPATGRFEDLIALLAQARLFIGADSGPLHAASLAGTPVVQILGPTDPVQNQPWRETPWRQVRRPIACSPCRRGCAAATCLRDLPPESVASAARELLAWTRPASLASGAGIPS